MRISHRLGAWLRSVFLRGRREAELGEELQFHLDRETERLVRAGIDPADARLQARRTFGSVEIVKEQARDARGTTFVDHLTRDARHAVRRLSRDWRFTVAAVVVLGLGIGVNTALFSVVNAVLFRQYSVADTQRVVDIYQNLRGGGAGANTYPAYLDIAAHSDVFASTTAAFAPRAATFRQGSVVRRGMLEHVSASYLQVLGLNPVVGRWFTQAEDARNAPPVAVAGHRAWTTRFASDPAIVGRILHIDGVPVTIVGVAPAGHAGTLNMGVHTDFWLPIGTLPAFLGSDRAFGRRVDEAPFFVKARLRPGVTVDRAQAAMSALGARLAREYPDDDAGAGISVYASSDVRIHPQLDTVVALFATGLFVIVGLVLAIACSNLATLLLVRGAARLKEVSVRLAVGATRAQLVRHLLTESVLLALGGGAAGCVLAWWTMQWLMALDLPVDVEVGLDVRVLAFAFALSLITGVVFGLAPALTSTRIELWQALRDQGGVRASGHRWFTLKNTLVVFQVAVSVFLLSGTGMGVQMVAAARAIRTGFAVDGVAMLETDVRYAANAARGSSLFEELRRRVAAIPGVEATALIRGLPMTTDGMGIVIEGAARAGDQVAEASAIWTGPGFFETMRIPILYGRPLGDRDRAGAPRAAVVSESMARRYFGEVNAVGRRFRPDLMQDRWMQIVGVARDTAKADLNDELVGRRRPVFYRSIEQWGVAPNVVVARSTLGGAALVRALQTELVRVDAALPALRATTMQQLLDDSLVVARGSTLFFAAIGILGLCLAGIGLYAVIAFAVTRRSREIGIRMALGADSRQVSRAVALEVGALVAVGTVAGLGFSLLGVLALRVGGSNAVTGIANLSFYRPSVDPVAMSVIAMVAALVGLAAAYVPARRAARMDPLIALRHD
jgi:macrolide transport system ATP-binding/permease protein